ncbi:MAG: prepilin-type N-terminal cleavage/methylation domain-containing protein [Gammaproteobacteria bacterium]|nr:MAG: prepilin-type N-terminal cleavage/methylation domain-containing protein [Gammaproteobacteria bacterium]
MWTGSQAGCTLRNKGFSLLEVLVAFAILALSLGTLMQVFSTGLRNQGVAEDYARAVTLARSRLAALEPPFEASEGREGDYTWRVEATPLEGGTALDVIQVKVTVAWRNRAFTLTTLRLQEH